MYNDNNNYGFPSDYCTEASKANMGSNVATIATVIARSVLRYAMGDTQIGDIEGDALKYRLCNTVEFYSNKPYIYTGLHLSRGQNCR